jgi:peptidoglycan/xylan/chitin deacetylase (PgdA/CDA1 family)
MISVCFRFDDPSAISDHELERRVFDIFARQDARLCVAAIPFARRADGESVSLSHQNAIHLLDAMRAGLIEVAQHGHSHVQRGVDNWGAHSEFAGVPLAEQTRLIAEGLDQLTSIFGHRIRGFVPPWNTYDRDTAQALDHAGFAFLSAGSYAIRSGHLAVIPRTCTLRNARDVLKRAADFQLLAPVVVVVFHPDDFREFKLPPAPDEPPPFTDLEELEALLRWIRAQPGLRVEELGGIADSVRNGKPLRNSTELKLPWRIKAQVPPILVRSGWMTLPGILWGALRGHYRFDA